MPAATVGASISVLICSTAVVVDFDFEPDLWAGHAVFFGLDGRVVVILFAPPFFFVGLYIFVCMHVSMPKMVPQSSS